MATVDRRSVTLPMHVPVVMTDGGAWCQHDQACPVCHHRKAVMVLHTGVFLPCGDCQSRGWILRRRESVAAGVLRWFRA